MVFFSLMLNKSFPIGRNLCKITSWINLSLMSSFWMTEMKLRRSGLRRRKTSWKNPLPPTKIFAPHLEVSQELMRAVPRRRGTTKSCKAMKHHGPWLRVPNMSRAQTGVATPRQQAELCWSRRKYSVDRFSSLRGQPQSNASVTGERRLETAVAPQYK